MRRGRREYRLGQSILRAGPRDVPIEIRDVRHCKLRDLTHEDARRDGFSSLEELQRALFSFYPELLPDDELTLVDFEPRGREQR